MYIYIYILATLDYLDPQGLKHLENNPEKASSHAAIER